MSGKGWSMYVCLERAGMDSRNRGVGMRHARCGQSDGLGGGDLCGELEGWAGREQRTSKMSGSLVVVGGRGGATRVDCEASPALGPGRPFLPI